MTVLTYQLFNKPYNAGFVFHIKYYFYKNQIFILNDAPL